MNINATLLVQVGNFFIAYLLFNNILLRPGYQALCEQELQQSSLEELVAQDKDIVEKRRKEQKEAWISFAKWCKEYLPPAIDRTNVFRGISTTIEYEKLSESQKETAQAQLANAMISTLKERYER